MSDSAFWKQLDAQNNENDVRINIASGYYNPDTAAIAQEWLRRREEVRALAASDKRDAREERTLALASRANIIALIAIAIAAISSASQIKWFITSVISWLH